MPVDCLILVCAYLAMKYEEIYPPTLNFIFPFIKSKISREQYIEYEKDVLNKLNANLTVPTASIRMQELLNENSD